jgi:immunoglobulin I-set domain protein
MAPNTAPTLPPPQVWRFPSVSGYGNALWGLLFLTAALLLGERSGAAEFQDMFANRETVTDPSGQLTGSNTNATMETGEPQTGGKPGGHSVWVSWVAPTNGVVIFDTFGSTFDTLLSAYYFNSTNDTTFDKLNQAARDDDDSPTFAPQSRILFGAVAGQHYEIAVDGYYGAVGDITLNWSFTSVTSAPPIVISTPNDRALQLGQPVTLSVNLQPAPGMQLNWRFNGEDVESDLDTNGATLFIPSLQATNIGRYSLRISLESDNGSSIRYETTPTELQVNSEGQTNALAQDKLLDSQTSPFIGEDGDTNSPLSMTLTRPPGVRPLIGVVRGYNGSQIFDTTYATTDPNEPPHCGVIGGSSYWLMYEPPTNGTVTLDTVGSTYDTVMEAYTFNGNLTNFSSYSDLISLACNNDFSTVQGPSRVQFPVMTTRQYLIVVDGVNGARGTAYLNYSLNTNLPPQAPALLQQPSPLIVPAGTNVMLAPAIQGSPPLTCFWSKDGSPLVGSNSASLFLLNVTTNHSGNYTLTITNDLGSLATTTSLRVVVPTQCMLAPSAAGLQLSWSTVAGQLYTVEQATSLFGPWQSSTNSLVGDGQPLVVPVDGLGTVFFRVRIN